MRTVSKLDKAKVAIGLDHPFFATILYKKSLVERKDIPTLAVNARGTIYYNPDFIEKLTVPQIVWGLALEVGHVIGKHATRRGNRNAYKWNYAGDAWINDTLDNCKVGERIPSTVDIQGSKDKTTEQIYNELPDNDGEGEGQQGSGNGSGSDYMDGDGMGHDVLDEGRPLTESEIKEIEAQTKIDIAEAAQVAKAKGKLSGSLAEFVADVLNVKTPWYDILERYMTDMTRGDYSWARPNRRLIGQGIYMPSIGRIPTMGEVVYQIDVSGSVSHAEIKYYNGHIKRITELCKPSKVHVIYTDTQVVKHEIFEEGEEVNINFFSGGGTCMEAGFDYLEREGITPSVVVTLTDGYDSYTEAPNFPVVWCVSSDQVPPYGEVVHFEMEI
jgi:predicted metal-dependent peptidase